MPLRVVLGRKINRMEWDSLNVHEVLFDNDDAQVTAGDRLLGPKVVSKHTMEMWDTDETFLASLKLKVVQKYRDGECGIRSKVHFATLKQRLPTDAVFWNNGVYLRRTFRFRVCEGEGDGPESGSAFEFDVIFHDRIADDQVYSTGMLPLTSVSCYYPA